MLDANLLIRAVLGKRVRSLIETYAEHVRFFTPEVCVRSAQDCFPDLASRRGWSVEDVLTLLEGEKETLINKVHTWNIKRNESNAKAHWQFTTADARVKLRRLYPIISN